MHLGVSFGFSPKFSTTVENTVEKRGVIELRVAEYAFLGLLCRAKGHRARIFSGAR